MFLEKKILAKAKHRRTISVGGWVGREGMLLDASGGESFGGCLSGVSLWGGILFGGSPLRESLWGRSPFGESPLGEIPLGDPFGRDSCGVSRSGVLWWIPLGWSLWGRIPLGDPLWGISFWEILLGEINLRDTFGGDPFGGPTKFPPAHGISRGRPVFSCCASWYI